MKKFVSLALALMLCLLSVGAMAEGGVPVEELKVGFIFIGDENEGYTANHYNGAKEMAAALGLSEDQLLIKWVVPENEECEDAAYDLADQGCQIIFGNSFGLRVLHDQRRQGIPGCRVLPRHRHAGLHAGHGQLP